MAWVSLFIAGILEVVWAAAMKESAGFSKLVPTAVTIVAMVASVACLAYAVKFIPLGVGYSLWTGIGIVGSFVLGATFFGEAVSWVQLCAVGLMIAGLLILKLASP